MKNEVIEINGPKRIIPEKLIEHHLELILECHKKFLTQNVKTFLF
jgi:hypothetical protein